MRLPLHSADDLGPRRRLLWRCLRPITPRRMRFFYEGHPALPGQLWYEDRRLIYNATRTYRPSCCYEIGTWRGGGSTYFTAQALADNGTGILHTTEIDPSLHAEAADRYRQEVPELAARVVFHLGDYREVYGPILEASGPVDMVTLDGPEDAAVNEQQFLFFLPWMKRGTLLFQHDWYTEKARLVRSRLEQSPDWRIVTVLSPPYSVGFALAIHQ